MIISITDGVGTDRSEEAISVLGALMPLDLPVDVAKGEGNDYQTEGV